MKPTPRRSRKPPKHRRPVDRSPHATTVPPIKPLRIPIAEKTFTGWKEIAAAIGRAIGETITVRTAQRWAEEGCRGPRLPVFVWPTSGRVYTPSSYLALWAKAWLARRRVGTPDRIEAR